VEEPGPEQVFPGYPAGILILPGPQDPGVLQPLIRIVIEKRDTVDRADGNGGKGIARVKLDPDTSEKIPVFRNELNPAALKMKSR